MKQNEIDRIAIASDVEAFLNSGGEIDQVDHTANREYGLAYKQVNGKTKQVSAQPAKFNRGIPKQ